MFLFTPPRREGNFHSYETKMVVFKVYKDKMWCELVGNKIISEMYYPYFLPLPANPLSIYQQVAWSHGRIVLG